MRSSSCKSVTTQVRVPKVRSSVFGVVSLILIYRWENSSTLAEEISNTSIRQHTKTLNSLLGQTRTAGRNRFIVNNEQTAATTTTTTMYTWWMCSVTVSALWASANLALMISIHFVARSCSAKTFGRKLIQS